MEFLDNLGDWFNGFLAWIEQFVTGLFGTSNERRIRNLGFVRDRDGNTNITSGSVLDHINGLEPEWEKKTDSELKESADVFRARLKDGETLDDLLPDAFAAMRESGKRNLQMRHYDVQMIGGHILHNGMIAEMVTGEGKTLVSTLPAFLNALAGKVHVITVNDYLAKRDMEWMGPAHMGLGLTVGAIQANMRPDERQREYACDITYGTNNEFGFDYLRDNMKPRKDLQVQGPLHYAIVDEIDNILIDEARTPLIISGPAHDDLTKYPKANRIVQQLKPGVDFEVKEKEHTCHLTEEGVRHAEEIAGVESFYTAGNMEWPHLLDNALKAHHLYKRDVNYVVENGDVVIVDEHTGRKMEGRQWSDGLHQAVEAKEGVKIKEETQTLATITLQNYFKLYNKLAGMTGTAMTEAAEFWKIYELDVIAVPTNRPLRRINHPDMIYRTEKEKWNAVVEEAREVHTTGRPILVGTTSIEQSELVSRKLEKHGIKHNVLNAKFHEKEAEIIAQAGRKNAVTIATNMAGRGTDIILGGNPEHIAWEELKTKYESRLDVTKAEWDDVTDKIAEREGMKQEAGEVAELGGLHVIGTERHDSRRIDNQLRGRAGRQGDNGSSRFFISMEDKLMRLFAGEFVQKMLTWAGWGEGEAIESKMVTRRIEGAQKKREEMHFDQRKNLLEYDELMDDQRKQVYSFRQRILDGGNCRELILEMIDKQVDKWTHHFLESDYRWETIASWAEQRFGVVVLPSNIQGMTEEQLTTYLDDESIRQAEDRTSEQIEENLPLTEDEAAWNWQALSRWANRQFAINTNDREMKKLGRDAVFQDIMDRARKTIEKQDYAEATQLLDPDMPFKQICYWLRTQFGIEMTPEELRDHEIEDCTKLIHERVVDLYATKEIEFPVAVGVNRFMSEDGQGDKYDRDGLLDWASRRFDLKDQEVDTARQKPRRDIIDFLMSESREFYRNGELTSAVDQRLDDAFPKVEGNGQNGSAKADSSKLAGLANWAATEFQSTLLPEDFEKLSRHDARERLMTELGNRFRPELQQAERTLLLEIVDTAWKDHLYYMGHVREGIGLVGYAQKDPKTEYKREGRRAFNAMWERIGEQVTGAIFRIEHEMTAFTGSLWQVSEATHQDASTLEAEAERNQLEPGQNAEAVTPIINAQPRVGRNDPCPCGSGKKYKKCCGKGL